MRNETERIRIGAAVRWCAAVAVLCLLAVPGVAGEAAATRPAPAGEGWSWEGVEIPVRKGPHPLVEQAAAVRKRLELILGARFDEERTVGIEVIERDETTAIFLEEIDREFPPEEIAFAEDSVVRFGLAPKGFRIKEAMMDLLEANIGGFYVPRRKTLFLIEGQPMQSMVTAHELTHAFQDQRLDLEAENRRRRSNDDASLAFTCFIEGEAVQSMTVHQEQFGTALETLSGGLVSLLMTKEQMAALERAPLFLRESLIYPYIGGRRFVLRAYRNGGFRGVRKLYDDLPASSEQILHPDKYFGDRDAPTILSLAPLQAALGDAWIVRGENTVGEFSLQLLLRTHGAGRGHARGAAPGWDGDRYAPFRRRGAAEAPAEAGEAAEGATADAEGADAEAREVLIWASTWDRATEAADFADAVAAVFPRVDKVERTKDADGHHVRWSWSEGRPCHLVVREREALYLDGLEEGEAVVLIAAWRAAVDDGSLFAEDHRDPVAIEGEEW